jgi:tRNA(Ile)-lysidine synthase
MHPAALAWAAARPRNEVWAVALSGGADSLCLLLLIWAHWPDRRRRLVVLHFDHTMRGAAARADARFCAEVCRALGVRCSVGRWNDRPRSPGEAQARQARFAFIQREMRASRARALWLGHQRDDIAETIFMRLARGSGTAGLAAPRPVHEMDGRFRVRPLLTLKKDEITAALCQAEVPWREDATNTGDDYFRNRLRRSVLPAWERAASRDAAAGAALSRELLDEDDAALEMWADSLGAFTPGGKLRLDRLLGKPRAIVRRVLHRWLLRQRGPGGLSRQGFAELLSAVEAGLPTRRSLGASCFAVISGNFLSCERRPKARNISRVSRGFD